MAEAPISFALVGGGWRAGFFLKLAQELPSRFAVLGLVVRNPDKGRNLQAKWQVPYFATLNELVGQRQPQFAVVSLPPDASLPAIAEAVALGLPVLTETPPGKDIATMAEVSRLAAGGARIQVAEQFHLQPLVAAQIAIARSGQLGQVDQVQISISYNHAVSLLRRLLGIGFEDATITTSQFRYPLTRGPSRAGDPGLDETISATQTIAHLDFGDRYAVYDFAPQQNRSWIRANRLLIRGPRGEISNSEVRYLVDFRTPVEYAIRRVERGTEQNLEGKYLVGLSAGERMIYRNPFAPAPWIDDEIAVASCLEQMAAYAAGGPGFYSVAEAAQDQYLLLMIAQAAAQGTPVRTSPQPWAA